MYAGTRGLVANYLDRPSMSLVTFIRKGLELRRDNSKRSNISQYVRSSGDIDFYRHYHGPMYAYWIALCTLAGVHSEAAYRSSGLIIHVATTLLIFWFFRLIAPAVPPIAAMVAALSYLVNRTALVTATVITQHVLFILFAGTTLFLMALYTQKREVRYWYATMASMALALCTVETSFILAISIVLSLLVLTKHLRWRECIGLLAKGIGVLVITVLIVWPKGVLQLNLPRGYLYLAYIALYRKTFAPISPWQLWGSRLRTYPWEFIPAALILAAAILWLRKHDRYRAAGPFILYACTFVAITMVITVPYTHYYGSLFLACAVLAGFVFGEVWMRTRVYGRSAVAVAAIAVLSGMTIDYYREATHLNAADQHGPLSYARGTADVLNYLRSQSGSDGMLYVPYTLIPTLHYYRPELRAVGYDTDWAPGEIAAAILSEPRAWLVCAQNTCAAVRDAAPSAQMDSQQISSTSDTGEPLYSARLRK